MNFKQIFEQYPKAWEKLKFFAGYNIFVKEEKLLYWVEEYKEPYPICNLYYFFDAVGVVITIEVSYESGVISGFYFMIDAGNSVQNANGLIYSTRPKAEEAGFIKAFEILESKL